MKNIQKIIRELVYKEMGEQISSDKLPEVKESIEEQIEDAPISNIFEPAAVLIGQNAIITNYFVSPELTSQKKEEARENVQDVQIKQGQIIVEENQLVDSEVYRKLNLFGLLEDKTSFQPFIGLGILCILFTFTIGFYFETSSIKQADKNNRLLLYLIVLTITLGIMKATSLFQKLDFTDVGLVVPVATGALLIKLLIDERLALITAFMLSICGSLIFNEGITGSFNYTIGIYYFFNCLAGIIFLSSHKVRTKILQAGLFISFVNIIILTSILLIQNGSYTNIEFGSYFIMTVISGIMSSVLTIGLLPFFESGFSILSTMKLIELSNPNHPLLRKILTDTPGTYHHSVMVANLSEASCEAIGANGLLARVGAYYHDIGKTRRPQYFIENQINISNPHDEISPEMSKNIIIAHAIEGAEMLRKHKMPKEIVDIAEQHHGTTLLKFFYHKAQELSKQDIDEEEFRYPGPKPQTKEIAIISIADSVEATVRSLKNPTSEKIEEVIKYNISERLQDGQFDECDITLKELNIVAKTMFETLKGIFHSRIEYPKEDFVKKQVKRA
ncbi:HDIG domain-containing protein [Bacillus carboniphilus]|uniref:HDIG domain-containing protein n=1 Tax=Bacillus carboniphilus TaxID=86663 RepID=A0ABY9K064_9BACI|nr:HDIG domain-containing metalloprotein [Bacillus carboniphilus]WLR43983.1 HDIG domain-containing protein [Bacillus carboniphilus]